MSTVNSDHAIHSAPAGHPAGLFWVLVMITRLQFLGRAYAPVLILVVGAAYFLLRIYQPNSPFRLKITFVGLATCKALSWYFTDYLLTERHKELGLLNFSRSFVGHCYGVLYRAVFFVVASPALTIFLLLYFGETPLIAYWFFILSHVLSLTGFLYVKDAYNRFCQTVLPKLNRRFSGHAPAAYREFRQKLRTIDSLDDDIEPGFKERLREEAFADLQAELLGHSYRHNGEKDDESPLI